MIRALFIAALFFTSSNPVAQSPKPSPNSNYTTWSELFKSAILKDVEKEDPSAISKKDLIDYIKFISDKKQAPISDIKGHLRYTEQQISSSFTIGLGMSVPEEGGAPVVSTDLVAQASPMKLTKNINLSTRVIKSEKALKQALYNYSPRFSYVAVVVLKEKNCSLCYLVQNPFLWKAMEEKYKDSGVVFLPLWWDENQEKNQEKNKEKNKASKDNQDLKMNLLATKTLSVDEKSIWPQIVIYKGSKIDLEASNFFIKKDGSSKVLDSFFEQE